MGFVDPVSIQLSEIDSTIDVGQIEIESGALRTIILGGEGVRLTCTDCEQIAAALLRYARE